MITATNLQTAIGCGPAVAALWAPHLDDAARLFGIDTPARVAGWLAQIGHESESLRYSREIWGPTEAQFRYEGRKDLGNLRPGDGKRYLGRGPIQITGRFNYARTRDNLRDCLGDAPDFETSPELLELPKWGALAAALFWSKNNINRFADAGDIDGMSDAVNRGHKTAVYGDANGFSKRLAMWVRAKAALGVAC